MKWWNKLNDMQKELIVAALIACVLAFVLPEAQGAEHARMVKSVDTTDLKSVGESHEGSIPSPGTTTYDVLSCCTKHKEPGYNGFNPGFGQEHRQGAWSLGWVVAINSHTKPTLYGSVSWRFLNFNSVNMGVTGICALGYNGNKINCIPPVPSIEWWFHKNAALDTVITDEVLIFTFKLKKGVLE